MARTGGEITRQKILDEAEALFSEKGFDGTGIDELARRSGINKATIYYHFADKQAIMGTLMESIIADIERHVAGLSGHPAAQSFEAGMSAEIEYMGQRARLLRILVMEALKSEEGCERLFRCADMVMRPEHAGRERAAMTDRDARKRLVAEFFTGFLPVMLFVLLRDQFGERYGIRGTEMVQDFVEAFSRAHNE